MDLNDDAQLLSRSRAGDTGAYAQLYERHVGTALHVARQLSDDDAEDVVSDAFIRVYTILREGRGPDVAFRPYLLRTVRNTAIDRHRRTRRVTPRDDLEEAETPFLQEPVTGDPAIDRLEQQFVARAFQSLPERWQTVLWHTEIQGETPAQVAPLLGVSPRAVAQLAVRAREGLRTAWLQEHVASAPAGHEEMVELLAAHIRGSLGLRGRRALESHLVDCPDCRRLRAELEDVNSRLGVLLVPALLGLSVAKLVWDAPAAAAAPAPAAAAASGGAAAADSATSATSATSAPSATSATTTDDDAGGITGQTVDAATGPPLLRVWEKLQHRPARRLAEPPSPLPWPGRRSPAAQAGSWRSCSRSPRGSWQRRSSRRESGPSWPPWTARPHRRRRATPRPHR